VSPDEPPPPPAAASSAAEESELCRQCLAPNPPGAGFCAQCGAPLSSYAATGPFERLFAEGHAYRRAAEQPQNWIVVLGIWLIFGCALLGGAVLFVIGNESGAWTQRLLGLVLAVIALLMLFKTTRNFIRQKRRHLPPESATGAVNDDAGAGDDPRGGSD
jgi:hypothetical protein